MSRARAGKLLNAVSEEKLRVSIKEHAVARAAEAVRRREQAKEYGLVLGGANASGLDGRMTLWLEEDVATRVLPPVRVVVAGHVLTVEGEYPPVATIVERNAGWRGICLAARELLIVRSAARRLGAGNNVQVWIK